MKTKRNGFVSKLSAAVWASPRRRPLELWALAVAALAVVVLFVPGWAEPGAGGPRRGQSAVDAPLPAATRDDLSRRLASRDPATFRGALVPAVAAALGDDVTASMLPPGSRLDLPDRFVEIGDRGAVVASITGPSPEHVRLHLVRSGGRWLVFTTEQLGATASATTSTSTTPATATASASASAGTVAPATGDPCAVDGTATPVLLVHGFADSPEVWETGAPSMVQALASVPDVSVAQPFDYSRTALRWVDDPSIGPALAQRIDCLARASAAAHGPGRVIVVAHSMGGLAARFAAAQHVGDRAVADDLALVVTIGTPETGSFLASAATQLWQQAKGANPSLLGALLRVGCGPPAKPHENVPLQPLCQLLSQSRAPAARAMEVGSPQLEALPPFPSSVPVDAIAGDVSLTVRVLDGPTVALAHPGDLVVGTPSAATPAGGAGRSTTIPCAAPLYEPVGDVTKLAGLQPLVLLARASLYASAPPCWHLGLPQDPVVQAAVERAIAGSR